MRTFLDRFISICLSLLLIQTPGAHAISYSTAVNKITRWFEGESSLQGAKLSSFVRNANGKQIRGLMISGGRHDGYVVLQAATKEARLKEWKKLKELIAYKKQSKESIIKALKGGDVLMRITPETLSFLVALGTIEYVKLILNPGRDPLGVYQQVESEKHPLTHLSFGAFMYSAGVATPVLQSLFSPRNGIQKYIPYLGMSAGMIASDVVNEISGLLDGKMDKCLMSLEQQVENIEQISTSCDKAFESWSEYSLDFLANLTPSLISLVVATGIAGQIEHLFVKKALVSMGLEMFLLPVTGEVSLGYRLGSWTVRTLGNVLPFVAVNEVVGHPIENTAKTYIQSANFRYFQKDLMASLVAAKKSNWEEAKTQKSLEQVLEATKAFKAWRKLNTEKITNTYNSWLAKVSSYAASYNLTEYVYGEFLDKANPQNRMDKALTLMRRPAPLFGINPLAGSDGQVEHPYDNPSGLMEQQLKNIVETSKKWQQLDFLDELFTESEIRALEKNIFKTAETAQELQLLAEKALTLTDMAHLEEYLKICDKIGKIFDQINDRLGLHSLYPGLYPGTPDPGPRSEFSKPDNETRLLAAFRSVYGNPFPINQVGGLFFAALESTPKVRSNSLVLKEVERINSPFGGSSGSFVSFRPAQAAFLRMFFGPSMSSSQDFIKPNTWNLPFSDLGAGLADFISPRLVSIPPLYQFTTSQPVGSEDHHHRNKTALNMPLSVDEQNFANLYEYALKQWPKYLAKDRRELSALWEKNVLPPYREGWKNLENTYNGFIQDYVNKISETSRSFDNTSPLYNGQIQQIDLERKFYSMILGEIVRSHTQSASLYAPKGNFKSLTDRQMYEDNLDPMWGDLGPDHLPLLQSLDQNSVLNLYSHVAQHNKSSKVLWSEKFPGQNMQFQNEIENDFASMGALIREVKNLFEGQKPQVVYTNNQIIEIRDGFTKKYDGWIASPVAGVGDKLTGSSLRLYQFCLRALKLLMNELATSALMANELNFERSNQNPGMSGVKDPECLMQAGGAKFGATGKSSVVNKHCNK